MPGHARVSDLLGLHANVSRRVRNLETGVHPTRADVSYYDSLDWANVTRQSPWSNYSLGATTFTWQFRQRFGVCSMRGGLQGRSTAPTDGWIGSIPATQAPERDTELQVILPFDAPYHGRAVLQADGQIVLYRGGAGTTAVIFDGVTWTPK